MAQYEDMLDHRLASTAAAFLGASCLCWTMYRGSKPGEALYNII